MAVNSRSRRADLLLLLGSILLVLVSVELGLRITGFSAPSFYLPDPHTGARHRPEAEGWDRREGEIYVRISRQGLRDVDHEETKPRDTFRIAILGDSYAEGLAVELEETFWRVAARRLASCPALEGKKIEPINFGVSGYGTAQELLALRHRAFAFDPDVVVLQLFSENDVRDNSRALSGEPLRPYFTLEGGALVLDDAFLSTPEYRAKRSLPSEVLYALIDHLRTLQLANLAKNNLRRRRLAEREGGGLEPPEKMMEHPIYSEPKHDPWREAWRVTDALIVEIAREVSARKRRFVLMSVSNPIQVHPDRSLRARFEEAYGAPDLFHPERHLDALALRGGFPYLETARAMQAEADRSGVHFHGFERIGTLGEGHWNAEGHRFAGLRLASFLCDLLR
jgi:hypothetical protein